MLEMHATHRGYAASPRVHLEHGTHQAAVASAAWLHKMVSTSINPREPRRGRKPLSDEIFLRFPSKILLIWQLAFLSALHVLPASLRTSAGTTKMSVSALRLVARPTGTAPLRARPAKAGNRARTAPRASGKDEEESAGGIDYASLERRVLNLKKQELVGHTGHLPVVVLDATLPNQRLALRFDAKDVSRRMHAGTELGKMAEVGDKFAMLGLAPGSRQVLPLGTEVVLSRISPWPDGSGDVEIELIGSRRIRIEGQPFNENGVPTAKVRARHPDAFLNAEPSVQKAAGARTAFSVTKFSLSLSLSPSSHDDLLDPPHERRRSPSWSGRRRIRRPARTARESSAARTRPRPTATLRRAPNRTDSTRRSPTATE